MTCRKAMPVRPVWEPPFPGPEPPPQAGHCSGLTPLPTHPEGGSQCLLKVPVSVLAEGLEDHGTNGHEWLHHTELQGGLRRERTRCGTGDEYLSCMPGTEGKPRVLPLGLGTAWDTR